MDLRRKKTAKQHAVSIFSNIVSMNNSNDINHDWIAFVNNDPSFIIYSVKIDLDFDLHVDDNFMPYGLEKNHLTRNKIIQKIGARKCSNYG